MIFFQFSSNVPGTDFSIGCDTALNEIVTVIIISYIYYYIIIGV